MKVDRLLQISVASMAALATMLLGMGQANAVLPTVAIFTAVTSVVFTDHLGWFRLHRQLANVVALVAVTFAVFDFFSNDPEHQLLSIANLLIYLQLILLFQEKHERIYWHLAVLSLLQVVVAGALNLGFEFGVLLLCYMFMGITFLVLMLIYRDIGAFAPHAVGVATGGTIDIQPQSVGSGSALTGPLWRSTEKHLVPAVEKDPTATVIRWALATQILKVGIWTLLLASLIFFFTPRFGNSGWNATDGTRRSNTGFSPEVSLNQMGRILESPETVMRVTFRNYDTGEPFPVRFDPYLRGSILTTIRI